MPHFIQLFCKQFQSISPDLSMHLFVINLCFSDYLATLFSFLDANCEYTSAHNICSASFKLRKHDVGLVPEARGWMRQAVIGPPAAPLAKTAHLFLLKTRHQVMVSVPVVALEVQFRIFCLGTSGSAA